MLLNRTPWRGQPDVRGVHVTSIHTAAAVSPSSSAQPWGIAPFPGHPFEVPWVGVGGAGDGIIRELSSYFLGYYLPKSAHFHPRHTCHCSSVGYGVGLRGHRTWQASATEGGSCPPATAKLRWSGLAVAGGSLQARAVKPASPSTLSDAALTWEQRWGLAWGVRAQEEEDPDTP